MRPTPLRNRVFLAMVVLTGLVLAVGCAGPFKAYEGPVLGRDEVAILKVAPGLAMSIVKVDKMSTSRGDFNPVASSVIVLPGTHSVEASLSWGGIVTYFQGFSEIWFDAEAGHAYILMGAVKDGKVVLWINDEETGETIAGTRVQ